MRAITSVAPPAANGTTTVTGRSGSAASAGPASRRERGRKRGGKPGGKPPHRLSPPTQRRVPPLIRWTATGLATGKSSFGQLAHDLDQVRFAFEADAGKL